MTDFTQFKSLKMLMLPSAKSTQPPRSHAMPPGAPAADSPLRHIMSLHQQTFCLTGAVRLRGRTVSRSENQTRRGISKNF